MQIEQSAVGAFEMPAWDDSSRDKVRAALLQLAATIPDTKRMFGARDEVDPVRHLVGTATGWGGNPDTAATYETVTPEQNDGTTVHHLVVSDVPVDGFWSTTVYNADGYLEANDLNRYSVSSTTARHADDGAVHVHFGGCNGDRPNCIPITPGWSYWVRLYLPRAEILSGDWTFPIAQPVPES